VPHGGGITKQVRRSMNNRSLNGRFKQVMAWVALRSGKQYLEWEEGGSTRTCHDKEGALARRKLRRLNGGS
jgi:putative transposase